MSYSQNLAKTSQACSDIETLSATFDSRLAAIHTHPISKERIRALEFWQDKVEHEIFKLELQLSRLNAKSWLKTERTASDSHAYLPHPP